MASDTDHSHAVKAALFAETLFEKEKTLKKNLGNMRGVDI